MGSDAAILARVRPAALRIGRRRARECHGGDGGHPDGDARPRPGSAQRQAPASAARPPSCKSRLRQPCWAAGNSARSRPAPARGPAVNAGARRLAAVVLVVLLVASPAQALIPDPIQSGLLAKIAALAKAIEEFRIRVMWQI